ncbi:hypothetical protein GJW-30_1_03164 [Variibacter gotjawalensis]|uniref:Uncharacterized protein n=1 Tax=Variibacter gotjawalensis TaxID=1333996 RepID=A0A0S3PXE1_9BRAD|nr:hypothetical protein [Variibacter gotjawalensis]NIK46448.1 hypothetical protein [Variibacter gotjawalensis]RZS48358.1 hypothetical protein EV661_0768 [Variibacter gotjawalensis]BAT60616.1 hypothetical protein GJW-30_1_03164 [Variibacter gotjawalensis]
MNPFEDPDQSYRRGYTQGAWAAFAAVAPHLPIEQRAALTRWINKDLMQWRQAISRGGPRKIKAELTKPPPDHP